MVADALRSVGVQATNLTAVLIAGGRSNFTVRLDDSDVPRWVLRMPPRAGRTPSAHDVAREFRVTQALGATQVPVAEAVLLVDEDDPRSARLGGPFAVAEFVDGTTIQTREQLAPWSDARLAATCQRLVDTLAALHRIDYLTVGLGDFGRPDGYAQRQLGRWGGQWERVGDPTLTSLATAAVTRLSAAVPAQRTSSIVHGDFRIDNVLLRDGADDTPSIAAVVDWELSTIGDPIADVAMMCAYRHPAFDDVIGGPTAWTDSRLPSTDQLAASYEAAGGVELANWPFHLALASYKIAVIAAGIAHRHRLADSVTSRSTAADAVEPFLEQALASAQAHR